MKKSIGIIVLLVVLLCSIGCDFFTYPTEAQVKTKESYEKYLETKDAFRLEQEQYIELYDQSIYSLTEQELKWMVDYCRGRGAPHYAGYQDYFPSVIGWNTVAQLYQLELNRRYSNKGRVNN